MSDNTNENMDLQKGANKDVTLKSQFDIKDFQSFYYLHNAKPDRETKFFRQDKIVAKEDLLELNDKIQEKLALHDCTTKIVSVIVSFDNDRTLEYGNWTLFESEKWATSAVTKSIILTWDFTVKLQGYQIPQRHTVKFRIGSRLKPKDLMELVWNHDDEFELHEAFAHAICTIDFINPVISSEVFLIIENWHKALPDNFFTNKTFKYANRHATKIEKLFLLLVLIAGCLLLFGASKLFLNNIWTNQFNIQFYYRIFGGLLLSFIYIHVLYVIGTSWSKRSTALLARLKPFNIFKLTKGDNNANEKAKKKNEGVVNKMFIKLTVTIIIAVLAYFSSYLFDLISKLITK